VELLFWGLGGLREAGRVGRILTTNRPYLLKNRHKIGSFILFDYHIRK
jgi:hypothetical protein